MRNLIVIFFILTIISCRTLEVNRIEYSNIHLDSTLVIDSKIDSIILPYRLELEKDMNVVLCYSKMSLFNGKPESTLTNFCADLMLIESDSICLKRYPNIHIDIAMINTGGLRVPIPKGEVKVQTMFELMPFENEVVFLKMSGSDVKKFADHIASRGGEGIAGLKFGIKDKKSINVTIQGNSINDSKYYYLSISDYLANGGDGSEILKNIKDRIYPGVKLRDMFINHLQKMNQNGIMIESKKDGRIYNEK